MEFKRKRNSVLVDETFAIEIGAQVNTRASHSHIESGVFIQDNMLINRRFKS